MSKHSVSAGDIAALFTYAFLELRRKAYARTGKSFQIIVIQERGRTVSQFTVSCWSMNREPRCRCSLNCDFAPAASGQDRRIDGEALLRALLAHKRGEPRVCSMVRAPTPEDEDRRRICRERKVLIMERVQHDPNRIKGLLFSSGHIRVRAVVHSDRRARLDALQTEQRRPSLARTSQSPGLSRTRSAPYDRPPMSQAGPASRRSSAPSRRANSST